MEEPYLLGMMAGSFVLFNHMPDFLARRILALLCKGTFGGSFIRGPDFECEINEDVVTDTAFIPMNVCESRK